jgi:hypothetical protein
VVKSSCRDSAMSVFEGGVLGNGSQRVERESFVKLRCGKGKPLRGSAEQDWLGG